MADKDNLNDAPDEVTESGDDTQKDSSVSENLEENNTSSDHSENLSDDSSPSDLDDPLGSSLSDDDSWMDHLDDDPWGDDVSEDDIATESFSEASPQDDQSIMEPGADPDDGEGLFDESDSGDKDDSPETLAGENSSAKHESPYMKDTGGFTPVATPLDDSPTSPSWDSSKSTGSLGDTSTYGDPNNVAGDEEGDYVFGNDDSILNSDIYASKDDEADDDFIPRPRGGFSGKAWAIIGAILLLILGLVTWLIIWFNTGNPNPIDAVKDDGTSTSSTFEAPSDSDTPSTSGTGTEGSQDGSEGSSGSASPDSPQAQGGMDDSARVKDLESSLESVIDESNSASSKVNDLERSIANKATKTHTVTRSGAKTTRTVTSDRTVTRTTTRNNNRVDTRTVTRTHRAPAPRPRTVTRTENRNVPGPTRTITKTVPTGRVTLTTTVIERWG